MNETGRIETIIQSMGEDEFKRYAIFAAVTPKIPALLSLLGSYTLLREISTELKKHNKSSNCGRNQRICRPLYLTLLAMSIADIFFSMPWLLTTWMAPSHLLYLWGNVGNYATCTLQAAIYQFGLQAGPLFSVAYSLLSLLLVRYSWHESRLQTLVPWIHGAIWTYAAIVSIFPIFLGVYNNQGQICWFESYPLYCETGEFEADCTRGENAWLYNLVFISFSPWFCLLTSIVIMYLMYLSVRETEDRMARYAGALRFVTKAYKSTRNAISRASRRYSSSNNAQQARNNNNKDLSPRPQQALPEANEQQQQPQHVTNRDRSNAVAWQAFWYTVAFLTVYAVDCVNRILDQGYDNYVVELDYIAHVLLPLQGLFNFMIFCRSKSSLVTPEGRFLRSVLFGCCSRCGCCSKKGKSSLRRGESTTARNTTVRELQDTTESPPAAAGESNNTEAIQIISPAAAS